MGGWKNLPRWVRVWVRPMLYISAGLHGLLLILPIPSESEPQSVVPEKTIKPVKLATLPPSPPPTQPTPLTVKKPARPPVKAVTPTKPNAIILSSPSTSNEPPRPRFTPVASPSPIPSPTLVASPTPIASPSPVASPTPIASPSPVASPTPIASPSPTEIVAEFPHLTEAQTSCNGGCWQIPETPFRQVSATLIERLETQNYIIEKQDIEDDTGRSVYKVEKDGLTQYLNVLATDKGDTVYLLAERELTRQELLEKLTF